MIVFLLKILYTLGPTELDYPSPRSWAHQALQPHPFTWDFAARKTKQWPITSGTLTSPIPVPSVRTVRFEFPSRGTCVSSLPGCFQTSSGERVRPSLIRFQGTINPKNCELSWVNNGGADWYSL